MPRKKKEDEEVEFDPEFVGDSAITLVPFSKDEFTTISTNQPLEFVLNCDLGRADLNENFRKIQDVINELKNNG